MESSERLSCHRHSLASAIRACLKQSKDNLVHRGSVEQGLHPSHDMRDGGRASGRGGRATDAEFVSSQSQPKFCGPGCFRKAWTLRARRASRLPSPGLENPSGRTGLGGVVVVVPFRDQLPLQDRRRQLSRFLPHMKEFLAGVPHAIVIVEQSQDGQKFNRGKLLNVGFKIAAEVLPTMEVFITHDVDLLPSRDMLPVYVRPPPESRAIHLASVWQTHSLDSKVVLVAQLGSPLAILGDVSVRIGCPRFLSDHCQEIHLQELFGWCVVLSTQ